MSCSVHVSQNFEKAVGWISALFVNVVVYAATRPGFRTAIGPDPSRAEASEQRALFQIDDYEISQPKMIEEKV